MEIALATLGVFAGVLTTLAGQGGGLLLLLACSAALGPHAALAITSPALLVGNLHRALLFRRSIDAGVAWRTALGAVPGALAGGLLAGVAPPVLLRALMLGMTALAIAKALGVMRFTVPRWALTPAGAVVGGLTGTSGGAGVLLAPVLLSSGLSGSPFVATTSAIAFAMHAARVAAYGSTGILSRELALPTALVALAIFGGNAVGERLRKRMSARVALRLEYGMLAACAALSVAGLG